MIIKNQCKAYNSFIAMLRRENRIWIVFKGHGYWLLYAKLVSQFYVWL